MLDSRRLQVLMTLALPQPAAEILEPLATVRALGEIPARERLAAALAEGVDVLCCQLRDRIDGPLLDAAGSRLRAVCNYAVGYDNVDVAAASARGIWVTNTPDVLTTATADCAMGLMLAAARRLREGDAMLRSGEFDGWEPDLLLGLDLAGATLAVVGFGRIGQALARRALAFEMDVVAVGRGAVEAPPGLEAVRSLPLDEALARADVVSLHAPLTPQTHHLIDVEALRRMKPTAVLVNTARGPLVDEAALVTALREGWIAAAGLDVYEREPQLAAGLADCPTAVLSPHLGSATRRTRAAMARVCAENAAAVLAGDAPPNPVDPSVVPR
jgi:glyoxylate reductase